MTDEQRPTYEPVYDGNLSDDPNVVSVLLPTTENIRAMRERGEFGWAFHLMCQDLWARADEVLREAGFKFETTKTLDDLMDTATFHAVYSYQANEFTKAQPPPRDDRLLMANEVCQHLRYMTGVVGDSNNQLFLSSLMLSAASLGYNGALIGATKRAMLPGASVKDMRLSDFQSRNQGLSVKVKTTWREPTLERLIAIIAKEPTSKDGKPWSNKKLAKRAIDDDELKATLVAKRTAALPEKEQIATWIGDVRRAGDLIVPGGSDEAADDNG